MHSKYTSHQRNTESTYRALDSQAHWDTCNAPGESLSVPAPVVDFNGKLLPSEGINKHLLNKYPLYNTIRYWSPQEIGVHDCNPLPVLLHIQKTGFGVKTCVTVWVVYQPHTVVYLPHPCVVISNWLETTIKWCALEGNLCRCHVSNDAKLYDVCGIPKQGFFLQRCFCALFVKM